MEILAAVAECLVELIGSIAFWWWRPGDSTDAAKKAGKKKG